MKKFIKIIFVILIICSLSCTILADDEEVHKEVSEKQNESTENQTENKDNKADKADSTNNETANNEEKKSLDQLKLQKSEIENKITKSNEAMEFIEGELSAVLVQVEDLQKKIKIKKSEIDLYISQEAVLKNEIEQAEKDLQVISDYYLKQKKLSEERLVAMHEMSQTTYLDVLLNSKSLKDLISNYYLINEIISTDKDLLQNVNKLKTDYEINKAVLEAKKEDLVLARENREKTAIALENMSVVLTNYMAQLSEEEIALHKSIEEYNESIDQIEREIRTLAITEVGAKYVGGLMQWPVPGYTNITSPYGGRVHPITGVYKLHTGVDIGAPRGASFVAANDGVVIKAEYNSAYGNMVMIDHGGGISTLYAHGDSIQVEVGQVVKAGEEVLEVGSTGYSTGPHAHFEVRIDGNPVEPLDYITSYNTTDKDILEVEINN